MTTIYVVILSLMLHAGGTEYREFQTLEQAKMCVEHEIRRWGQSRVVAVYRAERLIFAPTYSRKKVSETYVEELTGVDIKEQS